MRHEYHNVCDCKATQFRALYPVKTRDGWCIECGHYAPSVLKGDLVILHKRQSLRKNGQGVYDGRNTADEDWSQVWLA